MKPSIVVVDDDPIIRMDIREMLEEHGYSVTGEAKNGQEAIEITVKLKPDLVIMDMKMPIMGGIKAARLIRKLQNSAVLILTAYSQKDLVQEAREAGVTAYLVKPVSEENLLPAVEIALSQKEQMDTLKEALKELEQSIEGRKIIEKAKGIVMRAYSVDEEEAFRRMRAASMESRISLSKLAECILEGRAERIFGMARKG
ncbi:ANTAR domain-containing response regulator [Cohnella luojiensis]|uniref:Response regulator n=1 Tax=Cohnella luojiensis TaxID=652876 RepID=A0A4Y8LS46_9BACL|nr:response regulator [Cohnella luojiensis]TFE23557.1 response regulator [Cohnella luojiensis]